MQKHIEYDEITRDYAMFADGEYIGSRRTRWQAERDLAQHGETVARDLAVVLRDEAAERRELEVA